MTKKTMSNADSIAKHAPAPALSDRPCIHAKLQLQLVVPEECLVRSDIGAWYTCLQCGEDFRSNIKPYKQVTTGKSEPAAQPTSAPSDNRCPSCPHEDHAEEPCYLLECPCGRLNSEVAAQAAPAPAPPQELRTAPARQGRRHVDVEEAR